MNKTQVLAQLKSLGTDQNRKVYVKHGVKNTLYGVSYANLGKLKKEIKIDHELALELWSTGNHDARILATMIANPLQMTADLLNTWVTDLDNYVITEAFSKLASEARPAKSCMEKWVTDENEWACTAGWNVLTHLTMIDDSLKDEYLENYINMIETYIHDSKNRAKYSMNNALISIGIRRDRLEKKAIAAAKRIGRVEVDHGETSCQTPDAVTYIQNAVKRQQKKRR